MSSTDVEGAFSRSEMMKLEEERRKKEIKVCS